MEHKNLWFTYKPFPTTWISIILVLLLFPIGLSLPAWWGWENGPIENVQVAILGVGALVSFFAGRRQENRQIRNFWLWQIPFWLLFIGRELSWGRVF